ncbi:intracellular septation protein [Alphaproteobacteria bacterium]
MKKPLSVLSEFASLLLFFMTYKLTDDILKATMALVIVSLAVIAGKVVTKQKMSRHFLISTAFLCFFGILSVATGNPMFIKIKPTIVYICFTIITGWSLTIKQPILKRMFQHTIKASEEMWSKMTFQWFIFFLVAAITNELVWRCFTEAAWIRFKVFAMPVITIAFSTCQILVLQKNRS